MKNLEQEALKLASLHYAVFPLVPLKKTPLTEHGYKDATLDTAKIHEWWSNTPDANIGIACGEASAHLVVIDIDNKNGHDGFKSIEQWCKEHGDFPDTLQVRTPNDGMHLYFRDNERWNSPVNILEGVDIRGNGSYIVAPGSELKTGKYELLKGCPDVPAMINDSVRDLLKLEGSSKTKTGRHNASVTDIGEPVPEGGRNAFLSSKAGALVKKYPDWSYEQLADEIRKINETRCEPPLSDSELNRTVLKSMKGWKEKRDREPPDVTFSETNFTPEEWKEIQHDQADQDDQDDLELTSLKDIQEKKVEWLVPNYIPKRMLTVICGTGGVGKTTLWCSILASISQGKPSVLEGMTPLINVDRSNRDAWFFSSEDSTEYVLKETLLKNHVDMDHVRTFELSDERLQKIKFTSRILEKLVAKYKPALVVFDPLQSFIDSGGDMSKRNFMREQVHPLVSMGEKYNTTFVVIVHANKKAGAWGRYRMADSQDIWDQARSVLMVGEADKEKHTVYVSQEKCNVAPLAQTVILENTGRVMTFQSYSDMKDRDFVQEEQNQKFDNGIRTNTEECCNSILSELSDHDAGIMLVQDLDDLLKEIGYSVRTIKEAKKALKEGDQIAYRREIDPDNGKQKLGGKLLIYKK